ncbi:MAG TPA: ribonuclease J [Candidatus Yonathbacteria bacterium]|nr:ribonuclease J [Candidatus Yonathbacteria bacterium]
MEKRLHNPKADYSTKKISNHGDSSSERQKPVHARPKHASKRPVRKISEKKASVKHGMSKQQERRMGGHRVRKPSKPKAPTFKEPKPIEPGVVRVIPLGGVEEVGRNMLLVEYGDTIVVFDVGFHFIDEEETMGADYTLPNITYLEKNKKKIKAVVITHGHLDHIGGIPFIMERIGNPPIYAQNLTTLMIKKRQEEYPGKPELDIHVVDADSKIELSEISLRFFPVFHSIPDSMGIILETPYGNVVVTGDMKIAHKDGIPTPQEVKTWGDLGKENNLLFIADSTNAEMPGFSISEEEVQKNIEKIIQTTEGRLIIGTFASQFERLVKIIEMCERYNKKVVPEGRSIKTNIEIAKLAGFLKPKDGTLISVQEMADYPPDRVVVIATGAQGEEFAALMRIATNQHKFIKLSSRDTILLSSSVIPGNEVNIQKLKDNLYRHDPTIIHYRTSEVHSGGHGRQEDLLWINKTVKPKFFIPGYGGHSMLRVHAQVVHERNGFPKENIVVPDNGMVIEVVEKGTKIVVRKERAPANVLVVDGLSVGGVQEVVVRDRQMLAQDGIFVVIAMVDIHTGEVRKSPDIISRGFVYLREAQDMLQQARYITKKSIESQTKGMRPINFEFVKKKVADDLGRFLFQQTAKRPMVLPVLLGV